MTDEHEHIIPMRRSNLLRLLAQAREEGKNEALKDIKKQMEVKNAVS